MKDAMKKVGMSLAVLGAVLLGCSAMLAPVNALDDVCSDTTISDELKKAAGCEILQGDKTAMPMAVYLIEVAMGVVGILAAGMIVYGGITYIISTGDAAKLTRAKNTIIYGVVGVVVASLAYTIVYFVSQSIFGGDA